MQQTLEPVEWVLLCFLTDVSGTGQPNGLPHVQVSPPRVEIHEGETLRLYCRAVGSPSPSLKWNKRGGSLPPQVRKPLFFCCYLSFYSTRLIKGCSIGNVVPCFCLVLEFFLLFHPVSWCLFRQFPLTVSISLKATVSMCYRDVLRSYRSVHLSDVCLTRPIPPVTLHSPSPKSMSTKCMIHLIIHVTSIRFLAQNSL